MGIDVIAIANTELLAVRARIAALEGEASEIEAFLRVAARFASMEPQPQAAQTGPAMHPAPSAPAEQASVESSATLSPGSEVTARIPSVSGPDEAKSASEVTTSDPLPKPDISITISAKTPAPQPGSEAVASDAATVPAGEASRPDASPAPTSTRQRVKLLHDDHPEYTRREAWEALGITEGSLAGHSHALRIKWAPVEPVKFAPAENAITPDETVTDVVQARVPQRSKTGQFRPRASRGEGKWLHMSAVGMTADKNYAWLGTESQMVAVRRKFPETMDLYEEAVEKEPAR